MRKTRSQALDLNDAEPAAWWLPVAALKPWGKNPRKNDQTVPKIVALLKRYGWGKPLLIRRADGEMIAGHTTLKAVHQLIEEWPKTDSEARKSWHPEAVRTAVEMYVPVRVKEIDEQDAHEFAVADNRSSEFSEWDDQQLYELLTDFPEIDRALIGYSEREMAELQRALLVPNPDEPEPPHPNEGLVKKRKVRTGQLWVIPSLKTPGKNHRLLVGDSTNLQNVERLLGGELVGWMWTDPPYGVDYVGGYHGDPNRKGPKIKNDKGGFSDTVSKVFETLDPHRSAGAPFYIATADRSLSAFLIEVEKRWKLSQILVWDKGSGVMGRSDYHSRHELIIYGWKEGARHPWYGGRKLSTVFEVPGPKKNEFHPTMKPPKLIELMIANSSVAGSRGFEPFAGSGSTIVAAENLGRLCSAIEIDPLYAAAILERCAGLGMEPVLEK